MTDRYNYFVVGLSKDIREDDAQPVLNALRMVKGVATVEPHVANIDDLLAHERARQELVTELLAVLRPRP